MSRWLGLLLVVVVLVGSHPALSKPAAQKVPAATLASYRKHLRAGRKLGDPDDTEKHKGLPHNESYHLSVTLDIPAATAVVKLLKGAADERGQAALGPHKLW
jgi:hypothetical protein